MTKKEDQRCGFDLNLPFENIKQNRERMLQLWKYALE